jgi:uncharacterized protein
VIKNLILSCMALITTCSLIESTNTQQPEGGVRVLPQQPRGGIRVLPQPQPKDGGRVLPQPQSQDGGRVLPQPQSQDGGRALSQSQSATGQAGQKPPPRPSRPPLSSDTLLKSHSKENLPPLIQHTKPSSVHGLPTTHPSCRKTSEKSPILVLSIDGASVRGVAQRDILEAIERKVNEKLREREKENLRSSGSGAFKLPQESITSIFDFFAGTSAGSINVGAILTPKDPLNANTTGNVPTPKFTLDELETRVPEMLEAAFSSSTFRQMRTLGGIAGSKFTAKPLEEYLQKYTTGTTPESKDIQARMSDLVKPAVITSYDIRRREIMNFSTYEACRVKNSQSNCNQSKADDQEIYLSPKDANGFIWNQMNVPIWVALRSSSAASTYFKPVEIELLGHVRALVDAGLFVMSPAMLAYLEAQRLYPDRPIVLVSISGGALGEAREYEATGPTAGSIPKVLKPTIETCIEGQPALTHIMMKLLPNVSYFRIEFEVVNKEFDDVSEKNIQALKAAAAKAEQSLAFNAAIDAIVDARLQRIEKLKKDPNDFKPFICEAKENQMKTKAGALPDQSAVLKEIAAHQQKGTPLTNVLQEKLKQFKITCQLLKSSKELDQYNTMQCPTIENLVKAECHKLKSSDSQWTELKCNLF